VFFEVNYNGEVMDEKIKAMADTIRQTSFDIHCYLKSGHLEKVYENALLHRLTLKGLDVKQQVPLSVYDEDGFVLGDYFADLFVNDEIIIELKAASHLDDSHIAQTLGYMKTARVKHGMLINFGAAKLEIRKFIL